MMVQVGVFCHECPCNPANLHPLYDPIHVADRSLLISDQLRHLVPDW
jgi:hypothetical protein